MRQDLQKTIKDTVQLEGVGLHNGINANLILKPAEANKGINFNKRGLCIVNNLAIVLGRGYIGHSFRSVGEKKAPNGTA